MATKKKPKGKCAEPGCRRSRPKNGGRFCNTCKDRKWRAKYPEKYAYKTWKNNAKRRNIPFDIPFDYFLEFCAKTEILKSRGRFSESLHIDKIIDELGYVVGNIRPLPNCENVAKENRKRAAVRKCLTYDFYTGEARYQTTLINQEPETYAEVVPDSDIPF